MKKIPTIFKRNPEKMSELLREPHPDCGWVFDGEGLATRKYDGTCVLVEDNKYYKRREVKKGKTAPDGFVEVSTDPNTGKKVGWIAVDPLDPGNKYHMEAFTDGHAHANGTYELVGPKIQGNPEGFHRHWLLNHKRESTKYFHVPLDFDSLKGWLEDKDIEGLVFHHPDGRMAKIKKRDFGMRR